MTLSKATAVTDPGRRRRQNEDAFVCDPPLFAIADGMGGAQAGEIASHLAATSVQRAGHTGSSDEERVTELIQDANRSVYQRAHTDESTSGMGTTMTVALVDGDLVRIGHVGDSRAYLVRDHSLEQLTEDHSLVGELIRSGRLSPEEAEAHPHRSVITRVLGTDPEVDVDAFSVGTKPGDLFMLCSDGLTSMVDDARILELLEEHRGDVDGAARSLITEANANGGEDNITVILFKIATLDDTIELPGTLVSPAPAAPTDDEDTLSGSEDVPVVHPAAASPPPQPARPRRRKRLWFGLGLVVLAALLTAAVLGASRANFVGADSNGYVAVYQGLPWNLPFGIHLYREVYTSRLLAAELSQPERKKLFDHSLRSRGDAESLVKHYGRYVAGSR
ncbi:MAG TPA: Stp1/IreP family PP2C-type Ser/Thr phosphatase [Gaiellaceae bacterium]|nr:Stp1/IreP family PP2C-type Ser/Thr phosphatase [Gaiellaceae bacterium]